METRGACERVENGGQTDVEALHLKELAESRRETAEANEKIEAMKERTRKMFHRMKEDGSLRVEQLQSELLKAREDATVANQHRQQQCNVGAGQDDQHLRQELYMEKQRLEVQVREFEEERSKTQAQIEEHKRSFLSYQERARATVQTLRERGETYATELAQEHDRTSELTIEAQRLRTAAETAVETASELASHKEAYKQELVRFQERARAAVQKVREKEEVRVQELYAELQSARAEIVEISVAESTEPNSSSEVTRLRRLLTESRAELADSNEAAVALLRAKEEIQVLEEELNSFSECSLATERTLEKIKFEAVAARTEQVVAGEHAEFMIEQLVLSKEHACEEEMSLCRQQLRAKEDTMFEHAEEVERLRTEVAILRENQVEASELQADQTAALHLQEMHRKHVEESAAIETLRAELGVTRESAAAADAGHGTSRGELLEARDTIQRVEVREAQAVTQLKSIGAEAERLRTEVKAARSQAEAAEAERDASQEMQAMAGNNYLQQVERYREEAAVRLDRAREEFGTARERADAMEREINVSQAALCEVKAHAEQELQCCREKALAEVGDLRAKLCSKARAADMHEQSLQTELREATEGFAQQRNRNHAEATAQIENLRTEFREACQRVETALGEHGTSQAELFEAKDLTRKAEAREVQVDAELQSLCAEMDEARSKAEVDEAHNRRLLDELRDAADAHITMRESWRVEGAAEVEDLCMKLEAARMDVESAKAERDASRAEQTAVNNDHLQRLDTFRAEAAVDLEQLRRELDAAVGRADDAEAEIMTVQASLHEAAERELQSCRKEALAESDALRADLRSNAEAAGLHKQAVETELRNVRECFEHELQASRTEAVARTEHMYDELRVAHDRAETAVEDHQKLQCELKEATGVTRRVQAQAVAELESMRAELGYVRLKAEVAERHEATLRDEIKEAHDVDARRRESDRAEHAAEGEGLRTKLEAAQRRCVAAEAERDASRADHAAAGDSLAQQLEACQGKAAAELERLREELEASQTVLNDTKEIGERELRYFREEASAKCDSLRAIEVLQTQTVAELESLRVELNDARCRVVAAERHAIKQREEILEAHDVHAQRQESYNAEATAEVEGLRMKLEAAQKRYVAAETEIDVARENQAAACDNHLQQLEACRGEVAAELERLRKERETTQMALNETIAIGERRLNYCGEETTVKSDHLRVELAIRAKTVELHEQAVDAELKNIEESVGSALETSRAEATAESEGLRAALHVAHERANCVTEEHSSLHGELLEAKGHFEMIEVLQTQTVAELESLRVELNDARCRVVAAERHAIKQREEILEAHDVHAQRQESYNAEATAEVEGLRMKLEAAQKRYVAAETEIDVARENQAAACDNHLQQLEACRGEVAAELERLRKERETTQMALNETIAIGERRLNYCGEETTVKSDHLRVELAIRAKTAELHEQAVDAELKTIEESGENELETSRAKATAGSEGLRKLPIAHEGPETATEEQSSLHGELLEARGHCETIEVLQTQTVAELESLRLELDDARCIAKTAEGYKQTLLNEIREADCTHRERRESCMAEGAAEIQALLAKRETVRKEACLAEADRDASGERFLNQLDAHQAEATADGLLAQFESKANAAKLQRQAFEAELCEAREHVGKEYEASLDAARAEGEGLRKELRLACLRADAIAAEKEAACAALLEAKVLTQRVKDREMQVTTDLESCREELVMLRSQAVVSDEHRDQSIDDENGYFDFSEDVVAIAPENAGTEETTALRGRIATLERRCRGLKRKLDARPILHEALTSDSGSWSNLEIESAELTPIDGAVASCSIGASSTPQRRPAWAAWLGQVAAPVTRRLDLPSGWERPLMYASCGKVRRGLDHTLRGFTQRLLRRDVWMWLFYLHVLVIYVVLACFLKSASRTSSDKVLTASVIPPHSAAATSSVEVASLAFDAAVSASQGNFLASAPGSRTR
eukprot:TRINITY_DN15121_c0_g1_i2.p1 TRINITY_DN15121_c0_g1~~TRINITY_DN15121_c0_g1_i2.p1  ORF type:complete len:1959 (-),score=449.75 TRINITY_DN15121_c0_g1_i2:262-6138(-)